MNTICHFQCYWDSAVSMQHLDINIQRCSNYMPVCKNLTDVTPMLSLVLDIVFPLKWSEGCTSLMTQKMHKSNNEISQCFGQVVRVSSDPYLENLTNHACSGLCSFSRIKAFLMCIQWHSVADSASSHYNMSGYSRERLNIFRTS